MLELNTGNKITFVDEKMNAKFLKKNFDEMKFVFPIGLNEVDLIKLKILSEAELSGIVDGNRKLYEERIKDRLSCKLCNFYDVTEFGGIPNSNPFQYLHYFHPLCVTDWKKHSLMIGNGAGCPNEYFGCRRNVTDQYTDLYDYNWNLNGTVTKSHVTKRYRIGMDMNIVAKFSARGPNNPNFEHE